MARGCNCKDSECSCRIRSTPANDGNTTVKVTGSGTTADPLTIKGPSVVASDNSTIDFTIGYDAVTQTYSISAVLASTSKLDDLGDVVAPAPTNNQVLGWNSATSAWTPRNPTTAASGSVAHDASLAGDGSAGSQLTVRHSGTLPYTVTRSDGINLNDEAINSLVRRFATSADRLLASPLPDSTTLSITEDNPGQVDYWTGTQWLPLVKFTGETGDALLEKSGPYVDNTTSRAVNVLIDAVTDADGRLTVLDSASEPLASAAGILDFNFMFDSDTPFPSVGYNLDGGDLDIIVYQFDSTDLTLVPAGAVAVKGKLRAILY